MESQTWRRWRLAAVVLAVIQALFLAGCSGTAATPSRVDQPQPFVPLYTFSLIAPTPTDTPTPVPFPTWNADTKRQACTDLELLTTIESSLASLRADIAHRRQTQALTDADDIQMAAGLFQVPSDPASGLRAAWPVPWPTVLFYGDFASLGNEISNIAMSLGNVKADIDGRGDVENLVSRPRGN